MSQLGWKHKARSLIDIRQGEFRQTALMFAYNFLIIASHIIVKCLRDALFIHQVGAAKLPYVYIGIAIVAGTVMQAYTRFTQGVRRSRLIMGMNLFFISNLLVFWWLFWQYDWKWLSYGLYIWAGIFSAILVAQFWLVANDIFDPRQAKRLFGFILSGGTLGGIFAGIISRGIVHSVGTANLFLVAAAQLIGCTIIIRWINFQGAAPRFPSAGAPDQGVGGIFGLIRKSRHLTLLTLIIGVMVLATTLVDFQFKNIIGQKYPSEEELTGFFGSYSACINIITILFQLLVIGRLGVGLAILVMPVGLFLGSAATLISPVLWAAIFMKTCDDIFSLSINKWGTEILFIPIPASVKLKAKTFIDVVVERTSRGVAGLLLLFFTVVASLSISRLSIPTMALLVVWIFLCIRVYKEYIASLEATLQKRSLDIATLTVDLSDSSTIRQIFPLLDSDNERQIIYALGLLQDAENPELADRILSLCHHSSPDVRTLALRVLFNIGVPEFVPQVEPLVEDENEEVRTEAMHYVSVYGEAPSAEKLRSFLTDPDYGTKSAAITCITHYGDDAERALLTQELIEQMLSEEGAARRQARLGTAKALGTLTTPSLQSHLLELFNDENVDVVRQAILSAGRTQSADFVPPLVEMLGNSAVRVAVREALATYGPAVLDTLVPSMTGEQLPMSVRRQIPKVMGMIPHQDSADALLGNLEHDETDMQYKIVRALEDLRTGPGDIEFDRNLVNEYIIKEIRDYYYLSVILDAHNNGSSARSNSGMPASHLLQQTLDERLKRFEEMIFRLLGLIYPSESMYKAYRGVTSHSPWVRANAVELLENTLKGRHDRNTMNMLLPIIDNSIPKTEFMRQASTLWAFQPMTEKEAITALIAGQDAWLKACTLHAVGEEGMVELQGYVQEARGSSSLLVRESAEWAWQKLNNGGIGIENRPQKIIP